VSTRSRLFQSSWVRLVAAALIVSAGSPAAVRAASQDAAPTPDPLVQAIGDAQFMASIGEGILANAEQFCKSKECFRAMSGLRSVTLRQKTLLSQGQTLTHERIGQSQKLLVASFQRVIAAFEADNPELKDRIEHPDLASLRNLRAGDFPSLVPNSSAPEQDMTPNPGAAPALPPLDGLCGGGPGCSKSACRTQCVQLGAVFALMCAAYGPVCPPCAAICYIVLASQVANCYIKCGNCPNP